MRVAAALARIWPRTVPVAPLRPAESGDAPDLAAILSDWIENTPWVPRIHSRAEHVGFASRLISGMEVVVAGQPAQGFLARRDGFIHALYIATDARGAGLGGRLLDAAKLASDHLTLWTFQANAPARKFYARQGFAEVEFGSGVGNDEGLPDVRLVWTRDRDRETDHG